MPHPSHVYGKLSEKTMEMAKIFLALYDDKVAGERIETINQELDEAKFDLFNSLKSNEGMAYIYLRYPDEFSQLCANVVEAMREHSRIEGNPFKNQHTFKPTDFAVELDFKEEELIHYVYDKKAAFDRLEAAILESVQKTMGVLASDDDPIRYLVPTISGILARQLVATSSSGNTILDEKREKDAFENFTNELRPLVKTTLESISDDNFKVPEHIRDKIMSDVVCTDFFLMKLQAAPAPSFIKSKAASV